MLTIREEDVRRLLPMREAIRLLKEAFVGLSNGSAINQPRRRLILPTGAVLHQLAGAFGGYFGTKIYSTHPRGGAHFTVLLYESATGKPLAQFEANHLGQIRTGAATGVATDLLARADADTLGVIGSGFQAKTQIEAVLAVRPIRSVRVWSRDAERRETFARECSDTFGIPVTATASARETVEGAAILVTATFAKDPVMEAEWVAEGAHVNAVGSNKAARREIPSGVLDRAALVAVDSLEQARIESGDLLLAWPPETWAQKPLVELGEVATGYRGRTSPSDLTVFKSNGLGVQDIAVAGYVFERYS